AQRAQRKRSTRIEYGSLLCRLSGPTHRSVLDLRQCAGAVDEIDAELGKRVLHDLGERRGQRVGAGALFGVGLEAKLIAESVSGEDEVLGAELLDVPSGTRDGVADRTVNGFLDVGRQVAVHRLSHQVVVDVTEDGGIDDRLDEPLDAV